MTDRIAAAIARIESATGLSAILDAGYDGFELMLPLIEDQQDPDSGMFGVFVRAAACAANGRDALLFAPSLSPFSPRPPHAPLPGWPACQAATALAQLSRALTGRLGAAARLAAGDADRRACADGQREAHRLTQLLDGMTGV